jgi:hypothetical protein
MHPLRSGLRKAIPPTGDDRPHLKHTGHVSFPMSALHSSFLGDPMGGDLDATPNDEKREYQRFAVDIPATFRGEQNSGKGRITTLAIRGACFETESRLEHGARVSLTLSLPGMHPPVEIETAVVRAALGKRFGLEFLEIDSLDEERLRSHIEALIVTGPGELRKMYLNL